MVEKVEGFVCADGKFFKSELDARQYEARKALEAILVEDGMSEEVIEWIDKRKLTILEYVNARRPVPNPKITRA